MPDPTPGTRTQSLGRLVEDQVVDVRSGVAELRLDLGAVHDARVALRHLRATLTVFAPVLDDVPAGLAADLRWFSRQIATTRDAEVVAERLSPRLTSSDDPGARVLLDHLAQWEVEAAEAARVALEQPRTEELMAGLGRLHLIVPTSPQIYVDLRTQRQVIRGLEDLCDELPVALAAEGATRARRARALHASRKRVKAARAVADVLDVPDETRAKLVKVLRKLQDLLGEHHDAHVTREWLGRLGDREPATADLVRALRREERDAMDEVEDQLPAMVNRLVRRVDTVRRTPGVHLSSP